MKNCYWVVKNQLLVGEYPGSSDEESSIEKIDSLIQSEVSAFIDLTQEADGLKPYSHILELYESKGVSYQRFPIRDVSVPDSRETTATILDAIDSHLQSGKIVYVHCWGGVGRTGVVVGCWLTRQGFRGKAGLARLGELWQKCPKSAFWESPETPEQEQYVIEWEEFL